MRVAAGFVADAPTKLRELAAKGEPLYLVDRKGKPILHFDADKVVIDEHVQGTTIVLPRVTLLNA